MISALQSSASTKETSHLDLVLKPPKVDFSTCHFVHSPDPYIPTARNLLTDISNIVHRSTTTTLVNATSVDELSSLLSRSSPTIHFGRVAPVDRHDTDPRTQERTSHDTKLNAVTDPSSLGSNDTVPDCYFPVDVAGNSFALMELQTERLRTVEQFPNAARLRNDTGVRAHHWTSLVAPCPSVSPVRSNVTIGPCWCEDLFEGRPRVGEIPVPCGVIGVSAMSPIESTAVGCGDTSGAHPVGASVISSVTVELPFGENDGPPITALADWTSEWVHTLVIQPYLQGGFRFQYVIRVLDPSDLTFYTIQISRETE
jgi:hypothetical protein